MRTGTETKRLTTAQVKAGDVLIRKDDHLQRHDDRLSVTKVLMIGDKRAWYVAPYFREWDTPAGLCAQGYRDVERDGEVIGHFFVQYW